MPHLTHYLPELQDPERSYIQGLIGRMSHEQLQVFASAYRQRRKDPHTVLLAAIIGLVAFPGLQRFWLGQIGMGFIYLFYVGIAIDRFDIGFGEIRNASTTLQPKSGAGNRH